MSIFIVLGYEYKKTRTLSTSNLMNFQNLTESIYFRLNCFLIPKTRLLLGNSETRLSVIISENAFTDRNFPNPFADRNFQTNAYSDRVWALFEIISPCGLARFVDGDFVRHLWLASIIFS